MMSGAALIVAIVALGRAMQVYDGVHATRAAMLPLLAALICTAFGVVLRPARGPRGRQSAVLAALGLVALAGSGYALLGTLDGALPAIAHGKLWLLLPAAFAAAWLLAATSLLRRCPLGRAHVPLLLVVYLFVGVWIIRCAPPPHIDVYLFHDAAIKALLAGHSPYSTTIPNVYGSSPDHYYGPGLVVGDRVQVGHPYPPLSLLLAVLGYLAGDYRYALVAATTIAAGLIAYLHAGQEARLAAALLLFSPRVFFVCEQGWTEPFVVLMLAFLVFCAVRVPRLLPWALAGFLSSKQYAVVALPAVILLAGRPVAWKPVARLAAIAGALTALVALPFVVRDPGGFVNAVILFQLRQPFRADSLGFLPKLAGASVPAGPGLALVLAALTLAACLWRAPRGPAGFTTSATLTLFVFFAFATQAFWNYYFLVVGGLACAIAATTSGYTGSAIPVSPSPSFQGEA